MATMPSRAVTFPEALRSILPQVDRLYLYLDGHQEVPEASRHDERIIPIFSRDEPGLAGAGKFLGLERETEPCLYVTVDDDILYPPNYVAYLAARLRAHGSRAVVGVHGSVHHRPLTSYKRNRDIFHFTGQLKFEQTVDALGTGTTMFDTAVLRFDVRRWPQINMSDLDVAIEAAKSRLPMICVARRRNFLQALSNDQPDSIYSAMSRDDSRQTSRALELLALRSAKKSWSRARRAWSPTTKIKVFAMHGVADGVQRNRFQYRNLLEEEVFAKFLRSAPKFVPLTEALQGRGRALTIDDATVASGRAAKLAKEYGHAVTLFINPWNVVARQPYWFSRLNSLLDQVEASNAALDGREFDLTKIGGMNKLRAHVKGLMRRHTNPDQSTALIENIETDLGVSKNEVASHDSCLTLEDIRELQSAGVDLQNHYWAHLDPLAHNLAQFTDEFHKAKSWLKDKLGIDSRFFASPFGEFLPHLDFLRRNEAVCLLLHSDLSPGRVEDGIVNRITLQI